MSTFPQISEAEFEVMKIVWKYAPINTNEITEKLLPTTNWSPKTIQTLIKRLVTKGALTYEKQSSSFLNRYYDGNITAMVSSYIENDKLSKSELDTLRTLLSQKQEKGGE